MEPVTLTLIAGAVLVAAYYLYQAAYSGFDVFEKKGIPTLKTTAFVGTFGAIYGRKMTLMEFLKCKYNEVTGASVVGMFDMKKPVYLIRDPELIKRIAVKDFDHFMDHRSILDEKIDPLFGNNLVNLTGQKWRDMRATLSPMFTGSKMRQMFGFIVDIGEQMAMYFKKVSAEERIVEIKDVASRIAMDVIATTNFGVQINSLVEKENDFNKKVKRLMNFTDFTTQIKFIMLLFAPKVAKFFRLKFISDSRTSFLVDLINETMEHREKTNIERPDLIQLMLQLKKGALKHEDSDKDKSIGFATIEETDLDKRKVQRVWTDHELMAQAFIFFLAGFDTVATAASFTCYELALNPECQRKLQDEIDDVERELSGKKLSYELLQRMKYLDQVVTEGLRLWPPADVTDRQCVKDYKMTTSEGKEFTVEKGQSIWLPILAIHHSEEFYEEPMKFDPDRFSDENRDKINQDAFLPFGVGPRACIGSRFALMELKSFLYHLLRDFSLEPCAKTEIPIKMKKGFGKMTENGIWLEIRPRTDK